MKIKPPKPYQTFPLFAHAKGYWCKKIKAQQVSFGTWEWPDRDAYEQSWRAALTTFKRYEEVLATGDALKSRPWKTPLATLVDAFLTFKHGQVERKEITARMFMEYRTSLTDFREKLGQSLQLRDLEREQGSIASYCHALDRRFGWHAFNKRMTLIRSMFKWAADPLGGDILDRPFRLAGLFKKKSEKLLRRAKRLRVAEDGKDYVSTAELRALIDAAEPSLRAMILLAYFGAFGNTDCSDLPRNAIDRQPDQSLRVPAGWAHVHFPRPKTEIDRACVIPAVVIDALAAVESLKRKTKRREWQHLIFITRQGFPYVRDLVHKDEVGQIVNNVHVDSIELVYRKLRGRIFTCHSGHCHHHDAGESCCVQCREPLLPLRQMGFYALRHTTITDASGSADIDALSRWQGHSLPGMRRFYVEQVEAHKFVAIAECLHRKLFGFSALTNG